MLEKSSVKLDEKERGWGERQIKYVDNEALEGRRGGGPWGRRYIGTFQTLFALGAF